ncbi:hypothetical protein ANN_24702 [Periplaneta americana]|uniref:RNase H type-1 domain-containing protein n=1 Tax=Periplaneta americana TaxID=6978 RepID=A0ABQ8RZJ3_PERAM|nr:hypothetical protein ANN_24702 [Periplaneta americana]
MVKAHIGMEGNELADKHAKEEAEAILPINFNRKPITSVVTELRKECLEKWQSGWQNTQKDATCKLFSPTIEQQLKLKIPISSEFTAVVTRHWKTKAYLHRFKLASNLLCPCSLGEQTTHHLIHERQRKILKNQITSSRGNWPTTYSNLIAKHTNAFSR